MALLKKIKDQTFSILNKFNGQGEEQDHETVYIKGGHVKIRDLWRKKEIRVWMVLGWLLLSCERGERISAELIVLLYYFWIGNRNSGKGGKDNK